MTQCDINPFEGIKPETNVEYNEQMGLVTFQYTNTLFPFALASSKKY